MQLLQREFGTRSSEGILDPHHVRCNMTLYANADFLHPMRRAFLGVVKHGRADPFL